MRRLSFLLTNLASGIAALAVAMAALTVAIDLVGDPASYILGPEADAATRQAVRAEMGLDAPPLLRIAAQAGRLLHGELGRSVWLQRPVAEVVREHVPATLALACTALPLGILGGLTLGMVLGLGRSGGRTRRPVALLRDLVVAVLALPSFVMAIVAVQLVAAEWRLLPSSGLDHWSGIVLPALLLGAGFSVRLGLLLQDRLRALASQPFVQFARAKGLSRAALAMRHLLKPAGSLVLGYAALQLGYLMGGALVIETIFALPGLGRLAILALTHRDLPLLQACLLYAGGMFLAARLLADLGHALLDPRPGAGLTPVLGR